MREDVTTTDFPINPPIFIDKKTDHRKSSYHLNGLSGRNQDASPCYVHF